jgi:glutamate decarboxylase
MDEFALLSHGDQLPVFAFRAADAAAEWSVYDVSERLRARGWIVPAYAMPAGMDDVHVLRVVVRNGFSRDLAGLFVRDLRAAMQVLEASHGRRLTSGDRTGFHH